MVQWPKQLQDGTHVAPNGLRYDYCGADEEYLVVLGHPGQAAVTELCRTVCGNHDATTAAAVQTWARLMTHCPDHQRRVDDCGRCAATLDNNWYLDLAGSHPHEPGYFPITIHEC